MLSLARHKQARDNSSRVRGLAAFDCHPVLPLCGILLLLRRAGYPQQFEPCGRLQARPQDGLDGSVNLLVDACTSATPAARRRRRPVASGGPLSDRLSPVLRARRSVLRAAFVLTAHRPVPAIANTLTPVGVLQVRPVEDYSSRASPRAAPLGTSRYPNSSRARAREISPDASNGGRGDERVLEIGDIVDVLETWEATNAVRGRN